MIPDPPLISLELVYINPNGTGGFLKGPFANSYMNNNQRVFIYGVGTNANRDVSDVF